MCIELRRSALQSDPGRKIGGLEQIVHLVWNALAGKRNVGAVGTLTTRPMLIGSSATTRGHGLARLGARCSSMAGGLNGR